MIEVRSEVKSEMYIKKIKKRKNRAAAKGESRRGKREVACVGTKW